MKKVLALYDLSHEDFLGISERMLKNQIQKYFAQKDIFLEPEIIGIKDLFKAMEYFPPFMSKYIFFLNPIIHHFCCEIITYFHDRILKLPRTNSSHIREIIEKYCLQNKTSEVFILQTYRYDLLYHQKFVSSHLQFLFLDFPVLKKYHYQTLVMDKNYMIANIFEIII